MGATVMRHHPFKWVRRGGARRAEGPMRRQGVGEGGASAVVRRHQPGASGPAGDTPRRKTETVGVAARWGPTL
jgi:hypothetical protein